MVAFGVEFVHQGIRENVCRQRPLGSTWSMSVVVDRFFQVFLAAGLIVVPATNAASSKDIKGGGLFFYDPVSVFQEGTLLPGKENYEPSLARVAGDTWLAMLEFAPGKGDRIVVGKLDDAFGLNERRVITKAHGKYRRPTLTADRSGRLWLSYEALSGERWQVLVARVDAEATPELVSPPGAHAINHAVAALSDGGLAFAWQQDVEGQWDVMALRRSVRGAWRETVNLTADNPLGDWHPTVAARQDGELTIAWDAYDGVSFSIRAARCKADAWGKTLRVTDSDLLEARVSAAYDKDGRLCLAWEEGGPGWGKEYRNFQGGAPSITDQYGGVHRFRYTRLAVIADNGNVQRIAVPMPSFTHGRERDDLRPGTERLGVFYERPQLVTDETGRLWLALRHYFFPAASTAKARIISHKEAGWRLLARCFDDGRWSDAVGLEPTQRDGVQRLSLLPEADGFVAAWAVGRTHRGQPSPERGVALSRVKGTGTLKWTQPGVEEPGASKRPSNGPGRRALSLEPATVGGVEYQVYLGDLHRHTDLSLCRVYFDGSLDDIYRYATEAAEHDFLGVTDHARDISNGDASSQLWWRSIKEVTRHQLNGTFYPLFAFERSHGETDHNVVSLRDDVLRPHNPQLKSYWDLIDSDTITIPHNPIRPTRAFAYKNDAKRPLLEIYQGCRGNPMHSQAYYALKQGHHMGFIASSDHLSTSGSYACVWSPEPGREPLFRSLQARRTYGATAPIRLVFRAGDQWMGSILNRKSIPALQYEVKGTGPIQQIEVIRNGAVAKTISNRGGGAEMSGEIQGLAPWSGPTWIFLRVHQRDGQRAWSSPIWIE